MRALVTQIKKRDKECRTTIAVLLIVGLFLTACEDEESKRHLIGLKQIAAAIDIYPDFRQVSEWESNKPGRALFSRGYNSSANYEDVKSFYSNKLPADGWQISPNEQLRGILSDLGDGALVFRKGENRIAILRGSQDRAPTGRNFAITYVWEKP